MRRYVLAIAFSAVLAGLLTGIALILPACQGGGLPDPGAGGTPGEPAWGMAGGGPLRQGRSAYAGPDTPEIAWKYVVESGLSGGPVYIADGKLCISERRVVLAFNENGEVTWRYSGEQNVLHAPYPLPNGSVLLAFVDGTFARLNADGEPQWESKVPGVTTVYDTAFSRDGNSYAYANTDEGRQLIAVDPNGAVLWRHNTTDTYQLYEAQDGYLLGSTSERELVIHGTDGERLWQMPDEVYRQIEFIGSAPGGSAIVLARYSFDGGDILRMHGPQGEQRWLYSLPDGAPAVNQIVVDLTGNTYLRRFDSTMMVISPLGRASFIPDCNYSPVGKDIEGHIYAAGREDGVDYLYEINTEGQAVEQWELGGHLGSYPAFSIKHQLAYTVQLSMNWEAQQELGAFSFEGEHLWSYRDGGSRVYSLLLDTDGNCYLNSDTIITGLEPSGNQIQRIALDQGIGDSLTIRPAGNLSLFDNYQRLRTLSPSGELLGDVFIGNGDFFDNHNLAVSEWGFYLASQSELYGLNPDGSSRYLFPTQSAIQGGAAIDQNGTAYIRDEDHNDYAVSRDGAELWRIESRGAIWRYPVVTANGWALFPKGNGMIAVGNQGEAQWELELSDGNIKPPPAVAADGRIYAPVLYDTTGGPIGYTGGQGLPAPLPEVSALSSRTQSAAATATLENVDSPGLCALTGDGKIRWFLPLEDNITTQPVVDRKGRVYVLDRTHQVRAISPDGEGLWTLEVPYIDGYGDELLAISPQNRLIVVQRGVVTAVGP